MSKKRESSPSPDIRSPKKTTASKSRTKSVATKVEELAAKVEQLTNTLMAVQEETAVLRAQLADHDKRISVVEPTPIQLGPPH